MRRPVFIFFLIAALFPALVYPQVNITSGASGTVPAGSGTAAVGGRLCVNTTQATTTGTVEEVLATCSLTAGTLGVDGQAIHVVAWGTYAANANGKLIRIRFGGIGGTSIAGSSITNNNVPWRVDAYVVRTGAATQIAHGATFASTTAQIEVDSAPTQTLANAIDLVITGTTATQAGDVTFKGLIVELIK